MTEQNRGISNESDNGQSRKSILIRLAKPLITLACLILVAGVLWQLLPKSSFSSDLSQLGQGRPGLVLLREIHVMGGERVLEQMHTIYPEFEADMVFLLVHTGNPTGLDFAARHNAGDGSVVLFDARGNEIGSLRHPASAAVLRQFIVDTLAAVTN
ncbi:MAG: hypothetical protein Q7W55_03800 [Pseudohongiella sp.]|nr:hypothetical protein [Pseudohongiella sp.]MDO9522041.1 hypothetical protein [Pseudohongiella sp.]MDP2128676.1 hypothetical protein [Pseudohongiella sp.]